MKKMNLICKIFGHNHRFVFTQHKNIIGQFICKRCGHNEYGQKELKITPVDQNILEQLIYAYEPLW